MHLPAALGVNESVTLDLQVSWESKPGPFANGPVKRNWLVSPRGLRLPGDPNATCVWQVDYPSLNTTRSTLY